MINRLTLIFIIIEMISPMRLNIGCLMATPGFSQYFQWQEWQYPFSLNLDATPKMMYNHFFGKHLRDFVSNVRGSDKQLMITFQQGRNYMCLKD